MGIEPVSRASAVSLYTGQASGRREPTEHRPRPREVLMRWTLLLALFLTGVPARAEDRGLIGHWRFSGDTKDASGHGHHGRAFALDLTARGPGGAPRGAARFDGRSSSVEVPANPALILGQGDFTLAVWVHTEEALDDVLGDLVSKYDPADRRGLNWSIKNGPG